MVVEVDDSEEGLRAVEWAAGEAERVLATSPARAHAVAPDIKVTTSLPESARPVAIVLVHQ
ncbi:hypothetical protein [Streptosporangium sp. NPDC001681]|uniref:hypothetical protein n=1 Tax=Streptosporangium sp. NPDC001681 TaxID=3154395 RepID=UPI0033209A4B